MLDIKLLSNIIIILISIVITLKYIEKSNKKYNKNIKILKIN